MIELIWFVLAVLASLFKSKIRLEAENAALRHQVIVLRRKLRGRVHSLRFCRYGPQVMSADLQFDPRVPKFRLCPSSR